MMAGKLSGIERHSAPWLLAVVSLSSAQILFAQKGIQVSAPANTIDNPFVVKAQPKQPVVAEEPQLARRVPTTYENPFANMAKLPPVDTSLRPGPVSRWQRPEIHNNDNPLIKSAFPLQTLTRPAWDQLPPSEILRQQAKEHAVLTDTRLCGSLFNAKEVVGFDSTSLTQPSALTPTESAAVNFSLEPVQLPQSVSATENSKAAVPDVDKAAHAKRVAQAFEIDTHSPATINLAEAGAEMSLQADEVPAPEIVAECSDTPEGWLAQAREAASGAASAEELTNVIKLCERGIQQNPPDELLTPLRHLSAWTCNQRGELNADAQRTDESLQDFNAAVAIDSECSQAIHNRGVLLAQRNQYAAALRDFNRVIELNPTVGIAYRNRAELLAALDRMEEAVADYSEAIQTLPEDAALLRARAHAYQRLGDFAHASSDITRAIQLEPQVPEAFTERGNLQAEQGRFEEAQEDFRRAIAIDPNNADAHRSLAWLHATCPDRRYRNPQRALELANAAANLSSPDDYLILDTLAAAKACAGQLNEAVELEKKALTAAPAAVSTSLQQRLSKYQSGQAYFSGTPKSAVRAASHEAPSERATARPSPQSRPMK